jgi:NMD protein affecting ribosome stability and mRNA decay
MKTNRGGFRMLRREQLLQSGVAEDSYRGTRKVREPAACPECGAVYRRGRWLASAVPPRAARAQRCPACRRQREGLAAGYVTLAGPFFAERRAEILSRVRHCEAAERSRHPLEHIMAIKDVARGTQVTTTGIHIARRIGSALRNAYKGRLTLRYSPEENLLRVSWRR